MDEINETAGSSAGGEDGCGGGGCGDAPGRKRDREATKGALLDAAKLVFAERGYDAATTREIAGRAGVNEQLIQRYFSGKAGLLLAVVERYGREEGGGCNLPPPDDDLETDLVNYLSFQLTHTWQCRDFTKVVMDRALVDPAVADEMAQTLGQARIPCLLNRLEGFRARGAIAADADLANVAAGLATLSFGLGFVDQVVFGHEPERVRGVVRSLAHTIARGLAPRGR
ncbi:TetR/AcrR family transcriptional regulator [Azospirillum thermophilum]|uniref:TetR/AcrR family transcriptional regulator n=1 Tax=Azospirillum thermophilum TaxID=2202148 RepID=A0A2S2CSB1_9PROT|nr:TetR/AcrR family transcriptional regulator [Azospirillum thermophilum]AWK87366.1 TetR/AcrR family transcriptional regulator [Azospirillum thermophilum]